MIRKEDAVPAKPRIGRPPRTDDPLKVLAVLPGEMRRWLKARAAREKRSMSDIVNDALVVYREQVRQRSRGNK